METIFINTKISKTNETYKFYYFTLLKPVPSKSINPYDTGKYQEKYGNIKLNIIATWNDEFELHGDFYSVRYSRLCTVYNKKHETLLADSTIRIYINKINTSYHQNKR